MSQFFSGEWIHNSRLKGQSHPSWDGGKWVTEFEALSSIFADMSDHPSSTTHFVIRHKTENLFFNYENHLGPYLSPTPMLLTEGEAQTIMRGENPIWMGHERVEDVYRDLEIRQVEVKLLP